MVFAQLLMTHATACRSSGCVYSCAVCLAVALTSVIC